MSTVSGSLPYYKTVSKTATVTLAGATTSANQTFNTNIPFGKAMNIRQVRPVIARKVTGDTAAIINQILWELTEDSTKTAVSQTDPFALMTGGFEEFAVAATAASIARADRKLFTDEQSFVPPHPGVPTVAQQLNLVATGIRVVGASVQSYDVFLELYYELIDLSENIKTFLTNRIVLTRTT